MEQHLLEMIAETLKEAREMLVNPFVVGTMARDTTIKKIGDVLFLMETDEKRREFERRFITIFDDLNLGPLFDNKPKEEMARGIWAGAFVSPPVEHRAVAPPVVHPNNGGEPVRRLRDGYPGEGIPF